MHKRPTVWQRVKAFLHGLSHANADQARSGYHDFELMVAHQRGRQLAGPALYATVIIAGIGVVALSILMLCVGVAR